MNEHPKHQSEPIPSPNYSEEKHATAVLDPPPETDDAEPTTFPETLQLPSVARGPLEMTWARPGKVPTMWLAKMTRKRHTVDRAFTPGRWM